jgi:hypothetical protein
MAKKRTSLDSILGPVTGSGDQPEPAITPLADLTTTAGRRPTVKQQTVYLPLAVHDQLRRLAFEERAKMHDYLMEGLDLVFKTRGLPSVAELSQRAENPGKQ